MASGCFGGATDALSAASSSSAAPAEGPGDATGVLDATRAVVGGPPLAQPARPFDAGQAPLELLRIIDSDLASPAARFEAFDTRSLNIADLDGDGRPELVSLNDNQRAYVLDGSTGRVLAELETPRPPRWNVRDLNGVAIGDVDGDARPELAVLNSAGILSVLRLDHIASTPEAFVFEALWHENISVVHRDPSFYETHPWLDPDAPKWGADGNPFIVRLDDGRAVVLAQSDGAPAHIAFDANGSALWFTSWWDGNAGPWAGRLAPGGPVSALFTTDSGHVVAYDAARGVIRWTFDARAHGANPGSITVAPTVVDLRGDGNRSIFVGARVAVQDAAADWMQRQHARYFLLDAAGRLVWGVSFPWGNPLLNSDPAAVDVNGDGVQDLVVLDWNTIGHNPGAWDKTGPANLFAIDGANGKALWRRPLDVQWSNTGIAVAPFAPGRPPMVLTVEQLGPQDGLAFIGLDGERVGWMPLPGSWTARRGPVLADLDGDGLAEVVLPVSRPATGCPRALDVGCREGALLVYRSAALMAGVLFDGNNRFADDGPSGIPQGS